MRGMDPEALLAQMGDGGGLGGGAPVGVGAPGGGRGDGRTMNKKVPARKKKKRR